MGMHVLFVPLQTVILSAKFIMKFSHMKTLQTAKQKEQQQGQPQKFVYIIFYPPQRKHCLDDLG